MNKKILLIEDNKEMRENTSEILELAKFTVFTAKNGREGVDIAQKEKPDLIICDIMMPQLDGYGVLLLLSKNAETSAIPFIFLTAKAERGDLRKGMEMGADDYVTKPFDDVELLKAVESRLKKSELMRVEYSKNLTGLNEFIDNLKGMQAFKKLAGEKEIRPYKKKQVIYSVDGYPKGIFFVSKGKVKTYKTNEQGKEFITGLYKEGDFFGYLALLEEGQYSDSAMTLEDCELCMLSKEDFYSLLYKNADVSKKFIRILSDDLKEKEEQLIKLAYNSVRKRVAEALVKLHNRYKKNGEENFSMSISREDLSNLAGTAVETCIRTLSDFKEEGLVEVKGGIISIVNFSKLQRLKN